MFTSRKTYYVLLFDFSLTLLFLIGIIHIVKKSNLPFDYSFNNNGILVQEIYDKSNILITEIDGFRVNNQDELEMVLDAKSPGDIVEITYTSSGKIFNTKVTLTEFYSNFYIITCSFLTIVFVFIGIIVYLKKPDQVYALIFHWLCFGVAGIISLTWGNYNIEFFHAGKIARIGFHLSYTFTPVLFLHFAYSFPRRIEFFRKTFLVTSYSLAVILFDAGSVLFLLFVSKQSQDYLQDYLFVFDLFRLHVILWILTSIIVFIQSFRTSPYKSEKQKLLWLILGFIIGPGSFAALWAVPQFLSFHNLVSEEIILIMMTAIPVTFAIAILKYRLMDIEFVITRGFVYSFTLALLYSLYLLMIYVLSELTNSILQTPNVISVISFGLAALLFHPIRIRLEKFIDKRFYGIRYNFREALKNIIEEIKDVHSIQLLLYKVFERINDLIITNKIGFILLNKSENNFAITVQRGFDEHYNKTFEIDEKLINSNKTAANSDKIESGLSIPNIESDLMNLLGADIMIPIRTEAEFYGFLILGSKQSGLKYTIEDIDLLESVSSRVASTIERINLQENIIRNKLEMEKLDELNQMKSFFVSSVSHDLKTPLTSIKMFTEFLRNNKDNSSKKEEYLKIIEGETNRLTRLIDNVLDLTKIEKNLKEYQFEEIELAEVVDEVLDILEYQIIMSGLKITKTTSGEKLKVYADKDAVIRSVINLINNAIKFSTGKKEIAVSTYCQNSLACIEVKDFGAGIENDEVDKIFEPYVTSKVNSSLRYQGTGLGLAIVKHTMDAHKGLVTVTSSKGEGSTFTLKFPGIRP